MINSLDELPFIIRSNLVFCSEEDKKKFLSFYEKNAYYKNASGNLCEVDSLVFEKLANMWDMFPDELKKKQSLLAFAKYNYLERENTDYSFAVDDINEALGTNYPDRISSIKSFALSQINYAKDYISDEDGKYWRICKELLDLKDDKKAVYDFLNKYAMLNLNYIPNKIKLIDDYIPDRLNISFMEKENFIKDKTLTYEDFVGFRDKKNNFSYSNYLKSVDTVMELLTNDPEGKLAFRKDFQYRNMPDAISYTSLLDYNGGGYFYENDEQETDNNYLEENDAYVLNEEYTPLQCYDENFDYVSKASLNMCRTFGSQIDNFISRCMEVYNKDFYQDNYLLDYIEENPETMFEDEITFFSEKQFNISQHINSARLKQFSLLEAKAQEKPTPPKVKEKICKVEAQHKILDLLDALPTDFTRDKYKSFGKFVMEDFFYKDTKGNLQAHSLDELKKIVKVWPQLTPEQEKLPYKDILSLSQIDDYLNAQKQEFVEAAKLNNLSPRLFDIAQSSYIRGLDTPRVIDKNYEYSDDKYTIRLVDVKDPNIMFLGKGFSCQTIDKAGIYPTLSSVQDPFSRAMVIEQKGKPVGLAWLWVGQEEKQGNKFQSLCIDNLELADYVVDDLPKILSSVQTLSMKIADENDFYRVTMGAKATHYSPLDYYSQTEPLKLPDAYLTQTKHRDIDAKVDYGDSAHQVLLYENFLAQPLKKYDDKQFFVAHRDIYSIDQNEEAQALKVGDLSYNWKAEFREKDKNSQFMLLKNYQNEVVGYALYSDAAKHIHDVAVAPDYRRFSKKLLFELLNHMKEVGGTWEAETRKDTSYALLKRLSLLNMINLTEKETFMGIQGEKLYKTYISFPKNQDEKQNMNIQSQEKDR